MHYSTGASVYRSKNDCMYYLRTFSYKSWSSSSDNAFSYCFIERKNTSSCTKEWFNAFSMHCAVRYPKNCIRLSTRHSAAENITDGSTKTSQMRSLAGPPLPPCAKDRRRRVEDIWCLDMPIREQVLVDLHLKRIYIYIIAVIPMSSRISARNERHNFTT